jgi:hypothetical protein
MAKKLNYLTSNENFNGLYLSNGLRKAGRVSPSKHGGYVGGESINHRFFRKAFTL